MNECRQATGISCIKQNSKYTYAEHKARENNYTHSNKLAFDYNQA